MDGLPGFKRGLAAGKREKVAPIKKMIGPFASAKYHVPPIYSLEQLIIVAIICLLLGAALVSYGAEYGDLALVTAREFVNSMGLNSRLKEIIN
jgi:hypothetical protein